MGGGDWVINRSANRLEFRKGFTIQDSQVGQWIGYARQGTNGKPSTTRFTVQARNGGTPLVPKPTPTPQPKPNIGSNEEHFFLNEK